jgi:hypothetical protein
LAVFALPAFHSLMVHSHEVVLREELFTLRHQIDRFTHDYERGPPLSRENPGQARYFPFVSHARKVIMPEGKERGQEPLFLREDAVVGRMAWSNACPKRFGSSRRKAPRANVGGPQKDPDPFSRPLTPLRPSK